MGDEHKPRGVKHERGDNFLFLLKARGRKEERRVRIHLGEKLL
jgi:hypothetical protein